jgi:MFS superfamily sulfate permease-like transporter
MAYASVAGLPVAVGLYTAFIPMVIYAFLGSSRVLSVSSTTTLGILAGTQLGMAVPDGDPAKLIIAVATLTALVGVFLILAALLRLGFVANFISTPVLTGFKAGIGLVIVLDQLPKLLGIGLRNMASSEICSASPIIYLRPLCLPWRWLLRRCLCWSVWNVCGLILRRLWLLLVEASPRPGFLA